MQFEMLLSVLGELQTSWNIGPSSIMHTGWAIFTRSGDGDQPGGGGGRGGGSPSLSLTKHKHNFHEQMAPDDPNLCWSVLPSTRLWSIGTEHTSPGRFDLADSSCCVVFVSHRHLLAWNTAHWLKHRTFQPLPSHQFILLPSTPLYT